MDSIQMSHLRLLFVVFSSFLAATIGDDSTDSWLLRVKSELIDPAGVLENWSAKVHICSWNGLTCSDDQAHILGLNLSGSGLSGSLSDEFGRLTSLEILDLSSNLLTGLIPPELGQLQNLQILLLFTNYLSGKIPAEIGLLKKLQVLKIGNNLLTGEITPTIGNLTELRVLALAYSQFNGSIPIGIGNLKRLMSLDLQNNSDSGFIPEENHGCEELENFAA